MSSFRISLHLRILKFPCHSVWYQNDFDKGYWGGKWHYSQVEGSIVKKKIIFALNNFIESGDEALYKRFLTIMLISYNHANLF